VEARAFTETREFGAVSLTAYAPDWTWQKRDVNILLIARNQGTSSAEVAVALGLPPGQAGHFAYEGPLEHTLRIAPGETVLQAFAGITALDRDAVANPVPRQTYTFLIEARGEGDRAAIAYPVTTIRGAAVEPGAWALYLPAALALLWCAVFALALVLMAQPGAWRQPGAMATQSPEAPAWIEERREGG